MSMLYKDERVSAAGAVPQFPFLEKMLMERLITPCAPVNLDSAIADNSRLYAAAVGCTFCAVQQCARPMPGKTQAQCCCVRRQDVTEFGSMLKEHQKALLSDGFTVLESAALQHNIRAVSNIYCNIALDQLATLLGLPEAKVESLACDMIAEGRLLGHIDQARRCRCRLRVSGCLSRSCCRRAQVRSCKSWKSRLCLGADMSCLDGQPAPEAGDASALRERAGFLIFCTRALQHGGRVDGALWKLTDRARDLFPAPWLLLHCLAPAEWQVGVQVDNVIFFDGEDGGALAARDEHIRGTCEAVDKIIDVVRSTTAAA